MVISVLNPSPQVPHFGRWSNQCIPNCHPGNLDLSHLVPAADDHHLSWYHITSGSGCLSKCAYTACTADSLCVSDGAAYVCLSGDFGAFQPLYTPHGIVLHRSRTLKTSYGGPQWSIPVFIQKHVRDTQDQCLVNTLLQGKGIVIILHLPGCSRSGLLVEHWNVRL